VPRDAEPIGWPYSSIRPMPRVSDRNGLAAGRELTMSEGRLQHLYIPNVEPVSLGGDYTV
jgi:hypothetical protein